MKFLTAKKAFTLTSVAVALTAIMTGTAQANTATTSEQEVQRLRSEVNALKALIEQNLPQLRAQQQQQAVAVHDLQQQAKKASPLSIKTRGGAEAKVYGFVRADAGYKIKGANEQFANLASAPNDGTEEANKKRLNTTVAVTRLGLEFNTPVDGHKAGGKIEGDFVGNGYNGTAYRIRHAYLTYDNWLVGQTWSNFSDLNIFPDIIDFDLVPGQAAPRTMQVRYKDKLGDKTNYVLALEKNYHYERSPSAVARIEHNFTDKAYVSARGLVAEAKATSGSVSDSDVAWGVGLGAQYQVNDDFTLAADYHHMKGDKKHVTGANAAYVFNGNNIVLNEFDAISLSAMYKLHPKLRTSFGYGYVKHDDGVYATVSPTANKTLQQGWANVIYNPVAPVSLGFEVLHGKKETFSNVSGKDSRINLMAQYNF
ncbi:MAG: DcaP family trimeric outer membrane transporter [Acinetobacter sp.]|nr:DcaP family trimeric outer membrane transporter [Acinetobacter sp.]